jgi:hypothetical protein
MSFCAVGGSDVGVFTWASGCYVWVCCWDECVCVCVVGAFGSGVLVIGRAYGRGGWVI